MSKTVLVCGVLCALAVQAGAADGTQGRDYLKKEGDGWVQVRKDGANVEVLGPAEAPSVPRTTTAKTAAAATTATVPGTTAQLAPYVAYPVGSWPEAVRIGDVNGDGLKDVVMTTSSYFDPANDNKVFVFLQAADHTLQPPLKLDPGCGPVTSVDIASLDGSSLKGIVTGCASGIAIFDHSLSLWQVLPTGASNKVRVLVTPHGSDIVAMGQGYQGSNQVVVYPQALSFPVYYPIQLGGEDLEVADVNGDGREDIIVMGGQISTAGPNIGVLYQQPDGSFSAPVYSTVGLYNTSTSGIGVGDLTGDGRKDVVASFGVFTSGPLFGIAQWNQDASGTMSGSPVLTSSYYSPEPVEVGDLTGDLHADVAVLHGGWNKLGVYSQIPAASGPNSLGAETLFDIPYASHYNTHGLAIGDINGDGYDDVAIADYNNGLVVLRSTLVNHPPVAVVAPASQIGELGRPVSFDASGSSDADGDKLDYGWYEQDPWGGWGFLSGQINPVLTVTPTIGLHTYKVAVMDSRYAITEATGSVEVRDTTPPVVSITAPTRMVRGFAQRIEWTNTDLQDSFSTLYTSTNGGATWDLYQGCYYLGGTGCPWTPPAPGTFLLRIEGKDVSGNIAYSPAATVVVDQPYLNLTSPNTQVRWGAGSVPQITWTTNIPAATPLEAPVTVGIELTRDDGKTWQQIAVAPNTGSYAWTVTGPNTARARVRISRRVDDALSLTDVSDVNFWIK